MSASDWNLVFAREVVTNNGDYVEQYVTGHRVGSGNPGINFRRVFRYNGTQAGLEAVVRAVLDAVDTSADIAKTVVPPGTQLDLTPPTPTPPTQAELNRTAWFSARAKVDTIKRNIDLGSTHHTAQQLSDAQAAWNALTYDPAWEGLA